MTTSQIDLELRPVTLADAELVADLETARNPEDPRDPVMQRFWWTSDPVGEVRTRSIAEHNGVPVAYAMARHTAWVEGVRRFGSIRITMHPEHWTPSRHEHLIGNAESWLRSEGGAVAVAGIGEKRENELRVFAGRGYNEARRARQWELDLVANRERLLAAAEQSRERMAAQDVRMMTMEGDIDPNRLAQLYEVWNAAEHDIPTTVPTKEVPYDEWYRMWFENPGIRADRLWIAREGDAIIGLSAIEYPPVRGFPWTAFTGTSPRVRGRGIARALKYETVAQAITLGVERIRTENDSENAPILHLNAEMGYMPIEPVLELHRELGL
ncbi:MAG TPA: GNAT family N-acetyltransferase [Candidatus Dormibacteraeota bacterium]